MKARRRGAGLITVDAAAEELQLHPKTVLRCIRTGRLRATRIGKSYRILRADLDAFAGVPPKEHDDTADDPWVTVIVDMPDTDPEAARSWGMIPASLQGRGPDHTPMRAEVVYEPERRHLKVILVGSLEDTSTVLAMIRSRRRRM
jgi:excisionase family DNA binding protein